MDILLILIIVIWVFIVLLGVRYLFLRKKREHLKKVRNKLNAEKTNRGK